MTSVNFTDIVAVRSKVRHGGSCLVQVDGVDVAINAVVHSGLTNGDKEEKSLVWSGRFRTQAISGSTKQGRDPVALIPNGSSVMPAAAFHQVFAAAEVDEDAGPCHE